LHLGQHAHEDRNHFAPHHDQARTVRLPGRDRARGRHAARVVPAPARHQPARSVEQRAGCGPVIPAKGTALALRSRSGTSDPPWVRWTLSIVALGFLAVFLFLPVVVVFAEALRDGLGAYFAALTERDAIAALELTGATAAVAVPLNIVFGLASAWA